MKKNQQHNDHNGDMLPRDVTAIVVNAGYEIANKCLKVNQSHNKERHIGKTSLLNYYKYMFYFEYSTKTNMWRRIMVSIMPISKKMINNDLILTNKTLVSEQ